MQPRSRLLLVLLACLSLGFAALAPGASAASSTKRLQPGQVTELDVNLTAGQRVAWNITADATVPEIYNVHTHEPGNLSNVTNFDQGLFNRTINGTFLPPTTGVYSWFVENGIGHDAFTVTITVEPRQAQAARTPGLELPLLLLAALGAARRSRR